MATKEELQNEIEMLRSRLVEARKAYMDGYAQGETERIWLAQANSELRSELHDLKEAIKHGR